jgi:hypothetical protein
MSGTMTVDAPEGTRTFSWNGQPKERAAAKAEFDALMKTGAYLAYSVESPGKASAIREFDPELEDVRLSPRLVGG